MKVFKSSILWISDIHYSSDYETYQIENIKSKLIEAISNELKLENYQKLEYLILSGDITQSGSKEDYTTFKLYILDPLFKKLLTIVKDINNLPKILCVPGNHDVFWDASKFAVTYIDELLKERSEYHKKNYFEKNFDKFESLFLNYIEFVKSLSEDVNYNNNFILLEYLQPSEDFTEKLLYGYIVDKKSQLIFVLLNTAWFSISESFLKFLSGNLINEDKFRQFAVNLQNIKPSLKLDYDEINKQINEDKDNNLDEIKNLVTLIFRFLKVTDYTSEYNHQITAIEKLDFSALESVLKIYPDFVVITIMHHPHNWLAWEEFYSSLEGDTKLNKIFGLSDIILSGHEHVPQTYDSKSNKFNNSIHLKSGAFLNYKPKEFNSFNFNSNWFSILTFDNRFYNFVWDKFLLLSIAQEKNDVNIVRSKNSIKFKLNDRNEKAVLVPERQEQVVDQYRKMISKIESVFESAQLSNFIDAAYIKFTIQSYEKSVDVYYIDNEDEFNILLLGKDKDFFKLISNHEFLLGLYKIPFNVTCKKLNISICSLDLFVHENVLDYYQLKDFDAIRLEDPYMTKRRSSAFDLVLKQAYSFSARVKNEFYSCAAKSNTRLGDKISKNANFVTFDTKILPYWQVFS